MRTRLSERQWLIVRAALLPLITLPPFAVKFYTSCPTPKTLEDLECLTPASGTGAAQTIYTVLVVFLIIGLIASLYRHRPHDPARTRRFAYRQLLVALIAVTITSAAYAFMRYYSQGKSMYAASVMSDGTTLRNVWMPVFGLGISPATFVLVAAVYLATPLQQWYAARSRAVKPVAARRRAAIKKTPAKKTTAKKGTKKAVKKTAA